jgi:hypothetical protein
MEDELTYLKVGMPNAKDYDVIGEDGKRIRYVQWADTKKGLFQVVITDKNGNIMYDQNGCCIIRIKRGRIRLVKKIKEE